MARKTDAGLKAEKKDEKVKCREDAGQGAEKEEEERKAGYASSIG